MGANESTQAENSSQLDYYQLLDIQQDASQDDIKVAVPAHFPR